MDKAPDAFRTISEVAEELDVPQHVLRFWESRFHEIRPMKRGGGRRYYRSQDVDLLRGIRHLLYGEGYTIRGVQRLLREQGHRFVQNVWQPGAPQPTRPSEGARDQEVEQSDAPEHPRSARLSAPGGATKGEQRDSSNEENLVSPAATTPRLPREHVRKLQLALHELTRCRQLLDTGLGD